MKYTPDYRTYAEFAEHMRNSEASEQASRLRIKLAGYTLFAVVLSLAYFIGKV